jgi:hypothetical protein
VGALCNLKTYLDSYDTQKEYSVIKPDPLKWKSSDGIPASALHRESGSSRRLRLSIPGSKTIEAPTHL